MSLIPNVNSSNGGSSVMRDFQMDKSIDSKLDPQFGQGLAKYINSTINGTNSYYWLRNIRFRKNRSYANGKIDMSQFMDRLEMNGKMNYVNLNWSCIKLCNTIIGRMVGSWVARNEKVSVTAVDDISISNKKDQADKAEFVFDNKDFINQIQQESGVQVVPQDQFVAEDKDELDEWCSQFNNLPEEIKYELGVNNILAANSWFDVLKAKMLHDSAEVGLVGTYTYMNSDGEIIVEWVRPENMIYSYSEYPDFRDTTWRGRMTSLKVSELRKKYGKACGGTLDEEQIWQIAQTAKEYQLLDKITWNQQWTVSILRPYDEWNLDVMEFELRSLDVETFTVTKTKTNNSTLITKGRIDKIKENQKIVEDKQINIYRGVYAVTADIMLEWGIKKNMITPQDPKEVGNAEFSYSFYMYQSYDMRNIAVPEKIEEPLDQMIIARLKIQQLVAKMKPAGAQINLDALQELDLGLGGATKPLEVQKIWEQTGNLYYRGRDADNNPIPSPINELANAGFVAQMQGLITLYQFHYQVLKDELGQDPNLIASATTPRVAAGNVQSAIKVSDNTIDHMYDAYIFCMEDTSRKVACLLNKSVSYGAKKYRELLKEDEVKNRVFNTKVQMLPDETEIAKLESMMNIALESNPDFVLYCDTFKLIRVAKENVKYAELLFRKAQKRFLKSKQEQAQQNSQLNSDSQLQSLQAKAQADAQLEDKKNQAKERQIVLQGSFDLMKAAVPMNNEMQALLNQVIKNVSIPLFMENDELEGAMAQIEQEKQQQQQQAEMGQEQDMGQGQMQEQGMEQQIQEQQ